MKEKREREKKRERERKEKMSKEEGFGSFVFSFQPKFLPRISFSFSAFESLPNREKERMNEKER